jgi:AbiV
MKWMLIMAKRLPDEREAIKGAGVATATAMSLLNGADLVAGSGSCGIAWSLAVLALEESVKGAHPLGRSPRRRHRGAHCIDGQAAANQRNEQAS